MNKFLTLTSTTALLLGAFMITSCSSGGGGSSNDGGGGGTGTAFDGNIDPAAIDASNSEDIGKAAGEAVQKADASTGLPGAIAVSSSVNMEQINGIVLATTNALNLPAGPDVPGVCDSGSATVSDTTPPSSGQYNITITYTACRVTGTDITVDGTASIRYDDFTDLNAGFSITYSNFTVTDPVNGTTTIDLNFSCTNLSDFTTCTYNSDFVGSDGATHRVTDFTISGDQVSGFNGTATFLHGTFGEVSITITNITYGNCGVFPDGGTISFSSSNGSSGTIIFNADCTVSGTWDDGAGLSGSF